MKTDYKKIEMENYKEQKTALQHTDIVRCGLSEMAGNGWVYEPYP